MKKLSVDKIYYIRYNNVISECKFVFAKQMYSRGSDCNAFLNSVKYKVVLPNGEKKLGEASFSYPGYFKLFDVFESFEDCKNNVNAIDFREFYNTNYLFDMLYREGFGVDRGTERSNYGQLLFYRWDGFKAEPHNQYVITENLLSGEFSIKGQTWYNPNTKERIPYEMYRTAQECENAHQVKVMTFAKADPEPTPEQRRIKELETIIKNAQAELAKIGKC